VFDDKNATADELWEYCLLEYQSNNPIVQYLISNFFSRIKLIINTLDKNDRLLEVGCGAGASSIKIAGMLSGQHYEVSEYDERYVQKMREKNFIIPFAQESVYSLKRPDKSFDCIIMLEVLEHLEDVELALRELTRVSRKYVVISVPFEPVWRSLNFIRGNYIKDLGNTPGHINHWNPITLKSLLSKHGKVIKTYLPLPWIISVLEV